MINVGMMQLSSKKDENIMTSILFSITFLSFLPPSLSFLLASFLSFNLPPKYLLKVFACSSRSSQVYTQTKPWPALLWHVWGRRKQGNIQTYRKELSENRHTDRHIYRHTDRHTGKSCLKTDEGVQPD